MNKNFDKEMTKLKNELKVGKLTVGTVKFDIDENLVYNVSRTYPTLCSDVKLGVELIYKGVVSGSGVTTGELKLVSEFNCYLREALEAIKRMQSYSNCCLIFKVQRLAVALSNYILLNPCCSDVDIVSYFADIAPNYVYDTNALKSKSCNLNIPSKAAIAGMLYNGLAVVYTYRIVCREQPRIVCGLGSEFDNWYYGLSYADNIRFEAAEDALYKMYKDLYYTVHPFYSTDHTPEMNKTMRSAIKGVVHQRDESKPYGIWGFIRDRFNKIN